MTLDELGPNIEAQVAAMIEKAKNKAKGGK